jgi:hypothetical protein
MTPTLERLSEIAAARALLRSTNITHRGMLLHVHEPRENIDAMLAEKDAT